MKGNGALLSVLWVSPEDQAQMSAKSYSFKFKGCLALMRLRRGGTIRRELPAQGRYCASGIKTAWYTFCAPSEKRSWNLMKGGNPTLIPLCTVEERNVVMRNRVTWLKPREEFVAESEADPTLSCQVWALKWCFCWLAVDADVSSCLWSMLSLCAYLDPLVATKRADKVCLLASLTWGGLGLWRFVSLSHKMDRVPQG